MSLAEQCPVRHKSERFWGNYDALDRYLDIQARDGWEIVSVQDLTPDKVETDRHTYVIVKRFRTTK